jgi:RNA polymerase sigma-70 factor (ECF subfamily)
LRIVPPAAGAPPGATPEPLSPSFVSDDELIAALAAGELAALSILYERHARVVFAMLVRIVNDRSAAEDLLQEAFIRAWQHAHAFDETRGTARGWLHSIAHNLALNELRRLRRRPQQRQRSTADDTDEEDAALGAASGDPAVDAWCAIRDDRLALALAQLPPVQQDVLTLYAAGFSQSEIAVKLGQPLGTVKSRMRRALCHLREALPTVGVDAGWRAD